MCGFTFQQQLCSWRCVKWRHMAVGWRGVAVRNKRTTHTPHLIVTNALTYYSWLTYMYADISAIFFWIYKDFYLISQSSKDMKSRSLIKQARCEGTFATYFSLNKITFHYNIETIRNLYKKNRASRHVTGISTVMYNRNGRVWGSLATPVVIFWRV